MGYFQDRYNSGVINYDRRGFIRLATRVPVRLLDVICPWDHTQIMKFVEFFL